MGLGHPLLSLYQPFVVPTDHYSITANTRTPKGPPTLCWDGIPGWPKHFLAWTLDESYSHAHLLLYKKNNLISCVCGNCFHTIILFLLWWLVAHLEHSFLKKEQNHYIRTNHYTTSAFTHIALFWKCKTELPQETNNNVTKWQKKINNSYCLVSNLGLQEHAALKKHGKARIGYEATFTFTGSPQSAWHMG